MDEVDRRELCPACEEPMQEDWEDGSGCPECNPDYYDYHSEEGFQNLCDEYDEYHGFTDSDGSVSLGTSVR